MRPFNILPLLTLFSLLCVYVPAIYAQDKVLPPPTHTHAVAEKHQAIEDADNDAPSLQKELTPPQHTDGVSIHAYVRDDDQAKITEYSLNGRVFRIKVQPIGGLPAYYLEDSDGDGTFNKRLPGGYKHINPPMWVIQRF